MMTVARCIQEASRALRHFMTQSLCGTSDLPGRRRLRRWRSRGWRQPVHVLRSLVSETICGGPQTMVTGQPFCHLPAFVGAPASQLETLPTRTKQTRGGSRGSTLMSRRGTCMRAGGGGQRSRWDHYMPQAAATVWVLSMQVHGSWTEL
jgi:hypothetical protein